jgi:NAD(P)H-nitrite reductase large subunit
MRKDVIVCRCEEITEQEIRDAIKAGAQTIEGVKKMTRARMGLCEGRICERLIAKIISETTGQKLCNIKPDTSRPPVRPIRLGDLAEIEK